MDMKEICETCFLDPTSHSFSKLCQKDNISIFFTKPSEAKKYNDRKGIINHMENMLTKRVPDKWAWVFDADGFQQKHLIEIQLVYDIINLINEKYISNLEYIQIKNSNSFIKQLFSLITPFLKKTNLIGKITFD